MNDDEFIKSWDDLEDWIRRDREAGVARGHVFAPSMAISFVGARPDIFVETSPYVTEDAGRIVTGLIRMFGALRPERLAVIWPNMFTRDSGDPLFAVRLNLAEQVAADTWRWRTRVHAYELDAEDPTRIAEWYDTDIAKPLDDGSRRLRRIYSASVHRSFLRCGTVTLPPYKDWEMATHPASTTLDERWVYLGDPRHRTAG
jgi:hypothetical protein